VGHPSDFAAALLPKINSERVSRHDWFRNKTWNDEIAASFEARLKRSRSRFAEAQALRFQGEDLIRSGDPKTQRIGVELVQRVISDYPDVTMQITMAHETLGDYYSGIKDYSAAEKSYLMVPQVMDKNGNGTTEIWPAKLASAIFFSGQHDKYTEAKQMVEQLFRQDREPLFNSSRFQCFLILARLSKALGGAQEARIYAEKALTLAGIKTPQFPRHPNIGIVQTDEKVLRELRELAQITSSSKFLSAMRKCFGNDQ
jgi:tetratricopeptide (TPR) repeat protein